MIDASVLTPHQKRIIKLRLDGLEQDDIAKKLCITRGTVKVHMYKIYKILDVENIAELAHVAVLLSLYSYHVEPAQNQRLALLTAPLRSATLQIQP